MANKTNEFLGTGRRKTAIARVRLATGTGKITVNGRTFENYFPLDTQRATVSSPLTVTGTADKVDVRETAPLLQYDIPVTFSKKIHQPHLENFFNAIRGTAKLNCPADEAFRSEYVIHKANESIGAEKKIVITPGETEA